jgi:hypothetical protein
MRDREQFEATADVLRGGRELEPGVRGLARWISETFETDAVNIVIDALADSTPRLNVWLRTAAQVRAFRSQDGLAYDPVKQAAISQRYTRVEGGALRSGSEPEPLVVFRAFEPEARNRAIDLRPAELETLRSQLASPALWRIMVGWGRVVFFVHTDSDAAALRDGQEFQRWTTAFLDATRPRDEFQVLRTSPPRFELDSKERFDRDFRGSSYYYFL